MKKRLDHWSAGQLGLLLLALALAGCARTRASAGPRLKAVTSRPPLFRDIAKEAGIHFVLGHEGRSPLTILETLGGGCAFLDFDGDGWLDVLLVGPGKLALFRNDQHGRFVDVTSRSGLKQNGYWQGAATGDYDNDGRPDLYISGYRCCALYHNEGGGKFRDVTRTAGVQSTLWGASACFVDVDNDGFLDLLVTHYVKFFPTSTQFCKYQGVPSACGPTNYDPEKPTLYHNNGNGTFTDETQKRGLASAHGNALGVAAADYDGDGWTDIAIANDQLPGDLFRNKGRGYFEDVADTAGTAYDVQGVAHAGMGIDWGDYNNDGNLELVVTTYQHQPTSLYAQTTQGLFSDICYTAGIAQPTVNYVGFGVKFLDYDNDGLLDLALTNGHAVDTIAKTDHTATYAEPSQLFHNEGHGRLSEVSAEAGPDFARHIVGRGLATGDYDNDGRVDMLVVDAEGAPLLLHNQAQSTNHWLSLRLRGHLSNRDGIGAMLTVSAGGRKWRQAVSTGGSFLSASDGRAHIGLGSSSRADRIEIRWPSGEQTVLTDIPGDRIVDVDEGLDRKTSSSRRSAR